MRECIKVENYSKSIGEKLVLDGINLEVEKGKTIWIKGSNGSGKTMLLRAMSGLIIPDCGEIEIFGEKLDKKNRFPKNVGVMIENLRFWGNISGVNTLKILASIKHCITDEEIVDALIQVGLDPNDKRPVRKYSLGMRQRLAIAQAVMEKPDLLLLDEPTNALDHAGVEMIKRILMKEKELGTTIVIASHIDENIQGLYDETIVLEGGRMVSTMSDKRLEV